jgi:sugar phosphate isomerase/epimerase
MKKKSNRKLLYISNLSWEHKDFNNVIKLIKKYHYEGVDIAPLQISNTWEKIEKKISTLSNKLKENNIQVNALQGIFFKTNLNLFKNFTTEFNNIKKHIILNLKICKILNTNKIIIGSSNFRKKNKLNNDIADKIFVNFFKKIDPLLKKKKIYLCIETIPCQYNEDYIFNINHLLMLIKKINSRWIKVNFDTSIYHFNKFDKNLFLNNLKNIKNIQITEKKFQYLIKPSKKNIQFSKLIQKNKQINKVSLEILSKKTNLKKLENSLDIFKKLIDI